MPQFFLNKRLIILLIAIIILVALVGFSLRDRENASWPEQFVKDVVGFGENIVSKPITFVSSIFSSTSELKDTYKENQRLKGRLEKLAQLESEVTDLKKENKNLKDSLDIQNSIREYIPLNASVISRNPANWNAQLQIDKGSRDGIKPDMAVISAKGLVGHITVTGAKTSTVSLLSSSDTRNRISAMIQGEDNAYGIINGYESNDKLLKLKQLPYDIKLKKDQKVVTSGLGGKFPSNIFIGTIEKVETDKMGLSQTAYIKPGANLYELNYLTVLKRSAESGQPMDNKDTSSSETGGK